MTTSQPRKLKRVVIKEELVALTDNYIHALILNQFIYWSERRKDFDRFIEEEKQRNKDVKIELAHGWIYKSSEELSDELMLGMSPATIRRHLSKLVGSGYLDQRNNPNHKWDRTIQYRPNVVKIQKDLQTLGFALEGYPLLIDDPAFFKMKNGSSIIKNQTDQNEKAIPETPTETTTKIPQEGDKSPPLKAKSKSQKTERPAGVNVYRGIANRFPDKATWPQIDQAVGNNPDDLKLWGDVVRNYISCGWNKVNINGMLDYFKRREIPGTKGRTNGHYQRSNQANGHKQDTGAGGNISQLEAAFAARARTSSARA